MTEEYFLQHKLEEIDVKDYVRVLIRRKWFLIGVVLIFAAASALWSYQQPNVSIVESSFEIGTIDGEPIENPTHLVEKLKSRWPELEATNPSGTRLIRLAVESSDVESARGALGQAGDSVVRAHQEKTEQRKAFIQEDIELLKDSQETFEKQLARASDSFQQYFLYSQISSLQSQIHSLQQEVNNVQPTEIVRGPLLSQAPAGTRPVSNIAVGTVLGFFLGVLGAFAREWWMSNGKRKA